MPVLMTPYVKYKEVPYGFNQSGRGKMRRLRGVRGCLLRRRLDYKRWKSEAGEYRRLHRVLLLRRGMSSGMHRAQLLLDFPCFAEVGDSPHILYFFGFKICIQKKLLQVFFAEDVHKYFQNSQARSYAEENSVLPEQAVK